jgi:hypothetical protein
VFPCNGPRFNATRCLILDTAKGTIGHFPDAIICVTLQKELHAWVHALARFYGVTITISSSRSRREATARPQPEPPRPRGDLQARRRAAPPVPRPPPLARHLQPTGQGAAADHCHNPARITHEIYQHGLASQHKQAARDIEAVVFGRAPQTSDQVAE